MIKRREDEAKRRNEEETVAKQNMEGGVKDKNSQNDRQGKKQQSNTNEDKNKDSGKQGPKLDQWQTKERKGSKKKQEQQLQHKDESQKEVVDQQNNINKNIGIDSKAARNVETGQTVIDQSPKSHCIDVASDVVKTPS